jgi:hypothetical protein
MVWPPIADRSFDENPSIVSGVIRIYKCNIKLYSSIDETVQIKNLELKGDFFTQLCSKPGKLYFIMFWSILFRSFLFYSVLFYSILFWVTFGSTQSIGYDIITQFIPVEWRQDRQFRYNITLRRFRITIVDVEK